MLCGAERGLGLGHGVLTSSPSQSTDTVSRSNSRANFVPPSQRAKERGGPGLRSHSGSQSQLQVVSVHGWLGRPGAMGLFGSVQTSSFVCPQR